MGSFNTACVMTGTSMGWGPVAFVPLVRPWLGKGRPVELEGQSSVVSNNGAGALFVALTMPIFGELSEYGGLRSIDEDDNTRAIERAFGMPVADFVAGVTCGRDKSLTAPGFRRGSKGYEPFDERIGGCFVHRAAWDKFSTSFMNEFGRPAWSAWDEADMYPHVLEAMGFEQKGHDNRRERYNVRWVHPDHPRVTLWSDGQWFDMQWPGMKSTNAKGLYFSGPREVAKRLVEHGGGRREFSRSRRKLLRSTPATQAEYDHSLEQIREHHDVRERLQAVLADPAGREKVQQQCDEIGIEMSRPDYTYTMGTYFEVGLDPGFVDRFWPEVESGLMRELLPAWWNFMANLYSCNKLLMPNLNGPQCGNYFARRELLELAGELNEEQLRRIRENQRKNARWAREHA